jgi:hypothetical protein
MTRSKTWTAEDVRALGVRTDLVTACGIALGCGRDKARELYRNGELPFPALRVGRHVVVPVAHLLRFLGLDEIEAA